MLLARREASCMLISYPYYIISYILKLKKWKLTNYINI